MDPINPQVPFWHQPHIYVTMLLMAPIYYVVWKVVGDTNGLFDSNIKTVVITAVISTALGAVLGFWLGTSQSSLKKDEQRSQSSPVFPQSGSATVVNSTGPVTSSTVVADPSMQTTPTNGGNT